MGFLSILCCSSDSSSNSTNSSNKNSNNYIGNNKNNNHNHNIYKKDNNLTVRTNHKVNNHKQTYNKQNIKNHNNSYNNNNNNNTYTNLHKSALINSNQNNMSKNSNTNTKNTSSNQKKSGLNSNILSGENNIRNDNNNEGNDDTIIGTNQEKKLDCSNITVDEENTPNNNNNNTDNNNNNTENHKNNNNNNNNNIITKNLDNKNDFEDMDIDDEKEYDIDEYDEDDMDKEYINIHNNKNNSTSESNNLKTNSDSSTTTATDQPEKPAINSYSENTESMGTPGCDDSNQLSGLQQNPQLDNQNPNLVPTLSKSSKQNSNSSNRNPSDNKSDHNNINNNNNNFSNGDITYSQYNVTTSSDDNFNPNNNNSTNCNNTNNENDYDSNLINETATNNSVDPLTISNSLTVTTTADTQLPMYYNSDNSMNANPNDNQQHDDFDMMQQFDENEEFIDLTVLQQGQYHAVGYNTLLPPKSKQLQNKKCLILDLDETLVHSSFKYLKSADFVLPVDIDDQIHNVYVIKRPGVDEFLEKVGKLYEVVVFTASVSRYGDPLLDILDKNKTIHHRLFREACYNYEGNYIKNLSQIGRQLSDIIILDNSPASYIFHPQHAIPISSWFSDTHDNELLDIIPLLEDLSKSNVLDVGKVLDVSI